MNIFSDYNSLSDKEKKLYIKAVKFLYITIAIAVLLFYFMPFVFLGFCGEIGQILLIVSYIGIYPIFVFGAGLLYYKKFGFHMIIPAGLAFFYVPTTFIFYKDLWMLIFAFSIFVIGLFGELTGYMFDKRKKSKRQPLGLNRLVKSAEAMEKNPSKNCKVNVNNKNKASNKVNNKSNGKTNKSNKKK